MYKFFISINQKIFFILFISWMRIFFEVEKKEKIVRKNRPLLLVPNHVSKWDNFIVLSSLGFYAMRNIWRVPTVRSIYNIFFYRIFFKLIGTYVIEPKGDIHKSIEGSVEYLRDGSCMIFFPEGKIADTGQRNKAKKGIGFLVKKVPVDIIPVYIQDPGEKYCNLFKAIRNTKVIMGKKIKSEYFVENFDDETRSQKILDEVWKLTK